MGNVKSVSFLGLIFEFKSANPDDQDKIEAFVETFGFEKTRELIAGNQGLQEALEGAKFPEAEHDLPVWFDEMTPEQGAKIC